MEPKTPPTPSESDQSYDMFDYPRLYPSGWNLSESKAKPKKQPMPADYDQFPEPRTFPSGWDLDLED